MNENETEKAVTTVDRTIGALLALEREGDSLSRLVSDLIELRKQLKMPST